MAEKKITNDFFNDYLLVGIASQLKEYKFCFHLNTLLGTDFIKLKDLIFQSPNRTRDAQFSVFKAGTEDDKNQFFVFSNKNLQNVLLPEISRFDYLIQIFGKYEPEDVAILMQGIRNFPNVVMTAVIPLNKVKSKDRLIYLEEKTPQKLMNSKRFKQ